MWGDRRKVAIGTITCGMAYSIQGTTYTSNIQSIVRCRTASAVAAALLILAIGMRARWLVVRPQRASALINDN